MCVDTIALLLLLAVGSMATNENAQQQEQCRVYMGVGLIGRVSGECRDVASIEICWDRGR